MTAFEQRSFPGAAADTVLNGAINSSVLGFAVAAGTGTGFPDGSTGPFFVVIDYDNSSTEKLHCTARTGDTFTVDVRGADSTTALSHGDQAKVRACFTATDAQEANRTAHQTLGAITAKGDIVSGSAANTLVKTAVGSDGKVLVADSTKTGGVGWNSPIVGASLDATSTIDGVTGTQIAADHGAWTAWTPVVIGGTTNPTFTNEGSAYLLVGKTLHLRFAVLITNIGQGPYTVTVPDGLTAKYGAVGAGEINDLPLFAAAEGASPGSSTTGLLCRLAFGSGLGAQLGSINASTTAWLFSMTLEVA